VAEILISLTCTVLVKAGTNEEPILVTNFDPEIHDLIKEAECIKKLGLDVPVVVAEIIDKKALLLERKAKVDVSILKINRRIQIVLSGKTILIDRISIK
jgi:hypothetical protein